MQGKSSLHPLLQCVSLDCSLLEIETETGGTFHQFTPVATGVNDRATEQAKEPVQDHL